MPPALILIANLAVGIALAAVATSSRPGRSAAFAVLPLLNAVLLVVYVFGGDSYRGNGTSRWDAYRSPGGALGAMFVSSVVLLAACAALLAYTGLGGRKLSFRIVASIGGLTSLVLVTATIVGFTSN